jgi:hypothetical protein
MKVTNQIEVERIINKEMIHIRSVLERKSREALYYDAYN